MLFIDTWGWVALHNKRETGHGEVKAFYREYRLSGGKIYTTDYVLDETLTLVFAVCLWSRQRHQWSLSTMRFGRDICIWNG